MRFLRIIVALLTIAAHTGNSAFLRPPPALLRASRMYGPTTGMLPANPPMVEKKSPNKTIIPYSSTQNPTKGHRSNMSEMPPTKAAVPFHFCRRAKKTAVFWRPIMSVKPTRKRIWCSHRVRSELVMVIICFLYVAHS